MNDIVSRLSSRKLWLALGSFIVFIANKQYTEAMGVILAYIGVEGAKDAIGGGSYTVSSRVKATQDDYEVDTNEIVTGRVASPTDEPVQK